MALPFTTALVNSGPFADSRGRSQNLPPTRRILIEALILTLLSVAVFGLIFQAGSGFAKGSDAELSGFGINAGAEPVQLSTHPFSTKIAVSGGVLEIDSSASYSISARVQGIKEYGDAMSTAVPYDLLLAWGEMADPDINSKFTWSQEERQGMVSGTIGGSDGANLEKGYVGAHVSNNHAVPATESIRAALALIEPGDLVKIEGRLVDLRLKTSDKRVLTMQTSTSRIDQGDGACEIILIERIKVNEKYYN